MNQQSIFYFFKLYRKACTSYLKTIVITENNEKNYNFAINNVDQNIIALDIF